MLGRLEYPALAAPLVGQHPQHVLQVPVAGRLVGRLPPLPVAGQRHDALEEHRREVHGQELDLLVDVVGGHLVHALEVRHGVVHEAESHVAALAPSVGVDIPLVVRGHRFQRLPVRQRAQGGSADMKLWRWVVPVRGSPATMIGASIGSSRISGWRVSSRWTRSRLRRSWTNIVCWDTGPKALQLDVVGQGPAQQGQGLLEAVVAEVVGALGLDRQGLQLVRPRSPVGSDRADRAEDLLDLWPNRGRRDRRGRPPADVRSLPSPSTCDHGRPMRYSLTYPLLHHPSPPELFTGDAVAAVAQAAEAAGFDALAFTEHPMPSDRWLHAGGHDAIDPFIALTWAAAATEHLRLLTNITVVAYRNPFLLAKTVATLDSLSGGRVILGAAAGYLKSEFRALGVDFDERNELFDEALEVLALSWAGEPVTYRAATSPPRQPAGADAGPAAAPHLDRGQQCGGPPTGRGVGPGLDAVRQPAPGQSGRPHPVDLDRRRPGAAARGAQHLDQRGRPGPARHPLRCRRRGHAGCSRLRPRSPPSPGRGSGRDRRDVAGRRDRWRRPRLHPEGHRGLRPRVIQA